MVNQNEAERLSEVVENLDQTVSEVIKETDKLIDPVRKSAFRRFPTVFLLLAAFGASATIYGVEVLISRMPFLMERPWLIIVLGVLVLAATGRLYKKLE